MDNIKLGILASGNLGLVCINHIIKIAPIVFIYTDAKSDSIIGYCKKKNIPVFIGNPRNERAQDFIKNYEIDVLLSINYLFLINNFIYNHPGKFAINFHGSLLPKYRGRTPHVWAIINNEKVTGITAHLITDNCDEGDIIYQEEIPIYEYDTGADLLRKFESRYPDIINKVLKNIKEDTVKLIPQNNTLATYYGKRVPADGSINWNWQKERIRNWVRAQAKPYPGAFSYINNVKIVINKIEYSNYGYDSNDQNGKILSVDNGLIVKTQNGAVKLTDIELSEKVNFAIGEIFCERN